MNNKINVSNKILIKDKKRTVEGELIRVALYASSKVIEVQTTEQDHVYLIFFRNTLIYGEKLNKMAEGSFIEKAFRHGIVVESPHPLLSSLIPKQLVSIPNRNKLFSQLQLHFSPQEIAFIATTLDSFFEKETLADLIEKLYFDNRRNGKFMKAFQILQVLTDFMPEFKSAKERLTSLEFKSYQQFYQSSNMPSINEKDPLYAEIYCFNNRLNPEFHRFLEDIYKAKNRIPEIIFLWLEKVNKTQKADSLEKYTNLAMNVVTLAEWISILGDLNINPFIQLPEAKAEIEKIMKERKYETAALYLWKYIDELPEDYDLILKELWENVNAEFVILNLDHFIDNLQKQVNKDNQLQTEMQIHQLIVRMLEGYNLKTVYDKLSPLQKVLPHSLLLRKLKKATELLEDPDRMMELGDYYAEFNQYDHAIDCYSWEMELKPQDPTPVLNISKMYQQKGMTQEAATYRKVFTQLKETQGSI